MKTFVILFSCILILKIPLAVHAVDNQISAVVNNEIVTAKELEDFISLLDYQETKKPHSLKSDDPARRREALDSLIEDKLILQQARKLNLEVPQELVEKRIREVQKTFSDNEEFEKSLIERGINLNALKEKIKEQILMKEMVDRTIRDAIVISPHEITEYFEQNKNQFTIPEEAVYSALVFDNQFEAKQIYEIIKNLDLFELDSQYREKLIAGTLRRDECKPELEHSLFESPLKKFLPPQKVEDNYFIFYVEKRTSEQESSLAESNDEIWNVLFRKKFQEKFIEWVEKLRKNAVIKIYDQNTRYPG